MKEILIDLTLRDLRKRAKKTCAEVAQILGVTKRTVFRYEQGERTIGVEQVIPLANLYDVFIEDIVAAQMYTLKVAKSD